MENKANNQDKGQNEALMARLRGIATAQSGIAVATARQGEKMPAKVAALELGTAVGIIIALRIAARILDDKESAKFTHSLIRAGSFHEIVLAQLKSISEAAETIPKDLQEAAGFEVNHG